MSELELRLNHRFRRGSMFQEPLESELQQRQFRGPRALQYIYCGSNIAKIFAVAFNSRFTDIFSYCVFGSKERGPPTTNHNKTYH